MAQLRLTVHEARCLFSNLQAELRAICEDEVREFEGADAPHDSREFDAVWSVVDREFRGVYERTRHAIRIQDVDVDTADLYAFRGFCEDVDGMEARDASLIYKITEEIQGIQNLMEENATYRRSIPAKVEEHFTSRVQAKRRLYDALLTESPPRATAPDAPPPLPRPELLADVMRELQDRLARSLRLLDTVSAARAAAGAAARQV